MWPHYHAKVTATSAHADDTPKAPESVRPKPQPPCGTAAGLQFLELSPIRMST